MLVVPVGIDETGALTLHEWDSLLACDRILFERPDHPLLARLRAAGAEAGPFDDEPAADRDGWALVCEPSSARIVELARSGATVSDGTDGLTDSLGAAHAAPFLRRSSRALASLTVVMARLRSRDGCPWDQEQTHESLRVHLLEEAYEVLDAIDNGEVTAELQEELGDVLLQVFFHSQLAKDDDRFDIGEVAEGIVAKLIHRHPHVFGDTAVSGADDVVRNWEAIKSEEKERTDPFEGIPSSLPSLLLAYKVQKRASGQGFSAPEEEARRRVAEGSAESPTALGETLFWLVALARARGIDPEGALRSATTRFLAEFRDGR